MNEQIRLGEGEVRTHRACAGGATEHRRVERRVDLIGGPHSIDAFAAEAGTIGYEILTSLGRRHRRSYIENGREREGAA